MTTQSHGPTEFFPEVRRARYERLTIFEISETELDVLEKGAPDSVFLTFSVALLSSAASFTTTIATTKIESQHTFTTFVTLTIVGYVIGLVLLALWIKNRRAVSSCSASIRRRLPPEGTPQQPNLTPRLPERGS
jgi:hypothetical protein